MHLLANLSEKGYLILKKDRNEVLEKIKDLNRILNQFDLVLPSLESIYEPHIDVYEIKTDYWGRITIKHPDLKEDKLIEFLIGDIKTNSDPETLKSLSKEKARDEVKKLFPLYF
jgi:hypothetical protein